MLLSQSGYLPQILQSTSITVEINASSSLVDNLMGEIVQSTTINDSEKKDDSFMIPK